MPRESSSLKNQYSIIQKSVDFFGVALDLYSLISNVYINKDVNSYVNFYAYVNNEEILLRSPV